MKIVVDDKIPYIKGVLEPFADLMYVPGGEISITDVKYADALIVRTRTQVNKDLLAHSKVQFVVSATIGFDHIDTHYLKEAGITWENCPGCNADAATQYVISSLLTLADMHGIKLKGSTLGIIGVGNVGRRVENRAKVLGMNVLLNDPPRARKEGLSAFSSMQQIQDEADFITFHVPLNRGGVDNTFYLANLEFFEGMKSAAFLINCSRGEVVNNQQLKQALQTSMITGAVIDTWENEPHIDKELLDLVDIGTAHIAGYSAEGKANGTSMSVQKLCDFFKLDLKQWYPAGLPSPDSKIAVDCYHKSAQQIIKEIMDCSYSVKIDDQLLRQSTEKFEYLREHYYHRREPLYFSTSLLNVDRSMEEMDALLARLIN